MLTAYTYPFSLASSVGHVSYLLIFESSWRVSIYRCVLLGKRGSSGVTDRWATSEGLRKASIHRSRKGTEGEVWPPHPIRNLPGARVSRPSVPVPLFPRAPPLPPRAPQVSKNLGPHQPDTAATAQAPGMETGSGRLYASVRYLSDLKPCAAWRNLGLGPQRPRAAA